MRTGRDRNNPAKTPEEDGENALFVSEYPCGNQRKQAGVASQSEVFPQNPTKKIRSIDGTKMPQRQAAEDPTMMQLGKADDTITTERRADKDTTTPQGQGDDARAGERDFIGKSLNLKEKEPFEMDRIGSGGSDRDYIRIHLPLRQQSFVLMRYGTMYEENALYAPIARFLKEREIPVPSVYSHDAAGRMILLEDLGDRDLFSLRKKPWTERKSLYEQILAIAARIHAIRRNDMPRGLTLMPAYDSSLYRWEADYFIENLVENVCKMRLNSDARALFVAESTALSACLLKTPHALIHRDLQSQNVMIKGEQPVLIDFQGMRFGSPFYDLASLLYDPYVEVHDEERMELLDFYYRMSPSGHSWKAFRALFLKASAQRLMQALGAFGFLGLRRGKKHFLAHIPRALKNLAQVTESVENLSTLNRLSRQCQAKLG
jgi:N-acetylmuramate 1-kinase